MALLCKWKWRILSELDSVWHSVLKARYGDLALSVTFGRRRGKGNGIFSSWWADILKLENYIEKHFFTCDYRFTVGNGRILSVNGRMEQRDLDSCFKFLFGYDNLTDKYKLVAFHLNEVRVLTFGDNVWRNIQSFPTNPYEYNSNHANAGVYLSNSLNWFALRDNIRPNYYGCKYLSIQQFVIVSLDLRIETYTELQFPRGFDQVPVVPPIVWVLMECLCFSHYSNGCNFVIWQMKEFGVEESWTKLLKFDYHNILHSDSYEVVSLLPLYVFENEDMLIFSPNLKQLICYNWRENRVVRQDTVTDSTFMRLYTANQYVESLVSTY
ncbi:F-box protein CPR1-like [Vicia villosa]|uniref:F-box protein CPR1-like n=1 Tax=Vicia villosa TaxID=3911 RepID=UPI00273C4BB1|nr:F-box protein CPR1-like [Vicia villosa]